MFLFFIAGTKYRQKKIPPPPGYTEVPPQFCPSCQAYYPPSYHRFDKWLHFFFIPFFKLRTGRQVDVTCSNCHAPMVLPPKGSHSVFTRPPSEPVDLSQMPKGKADDPSQARPTHVATCSCCGMPWYPGILFCPNDGTPRPSDV